MGKRRDAQRAAAGLAAPIAEVEALLLLFEGLPFTPPRARMMAAATNRLLGTATSLRGCKANHTRAHARRAFQAAVNYVHEVERACPHLTLTPCTTIPWPGWHRTLAQFEKAHPRPAGRGRRRSWL
jgi:hypothetical protein